METFRIGRPVLRAATLVLVLLVVSPGALAAPPADPWPRAPPLTADRISLSDLRPEDIPPFTTQPAGVVEVPVHVMFMGVPQSLLNTALIESNLIESYEPTAMEPADQAGVVNRYLRATFNYSFTVLPASAGNAYAAWLEANHRIEQAPYWIQELRDFPANSIGVVDANDAYDWLEANLAFYLEPGYTVLIIDAYHTTPSMAFDRYYLYENVVVDVDTNFMLRPHRSRFLTGFGGGASRMLFIDLSSGPTDIGFDFGIRVNRTTMPPVWDYTPFEQTRFSQDVASYVNDAVRLRFVPSYLYPPLLSPSYFVEVTIYNDVSGRSFLPYIDLNAVLTTFRDLQPFAVWDGSVREVALASDFALSTVVRQGTDPFAETVDDQAIEDYLRENLDRFVGNHGDAAVIPLILFAFPGRLSFASGALGAAAGIGGNAAFIYAHLNEEWIGRIPNLFLSGMSSTTWALASLTIPSGSSAFFTGGAANGPNAVLAGRAKHSWLNGTFDVTSGSVDFSLFTEFEYRNWTRGGGDPIVSGADLTGPGWTFSVELTAPGYYYAVFTPSAGTSPDVDFVATLEEFYGIGFTQTVVHEAGHFLGLAHPHDGVRWVDDAPEFYTHWFYDFSFSPMSYVVSPYTFDRFDRDTVLRGNAATVLSNALALLRAMRDLMIEEKVRFVPYNVLDFVNVTFASMVASLLAIQENRFDEAVAAAMNARSAAAVAALVLVADLGVAPILRAALTDADGVLAGAPEAAVFGNVYDIRNFTLEILLDGQVRGVTYGKHGEFNVTIRNIPWGRHEIAVRATDPNGTAMVARFTVEVPVPVLLLASIGGAVAGAAIAGILLLRRKRRRPIGLPPSAPPPALDVAPSAIEDLPPPPPDWPGPPP